MAARGVTFDLECTRTREFFELSTAESEHVLMREEADQEKGVRTGLGMLEGFGVSCAARLVRGLFGLRRWGIIA